MPFSWLTDSTVQNFSFILEQEKCWVIREDGSTVQRLTQEEPPWLDERSCHPICPIVNVTDCTELPVAAWINKERPARGFITPNAALRCVCSVKVKSVVGSSLSNRPTQCLQSEKFVAWKLKKFPKGESTAALFLFYNHSSHFWVTHCYCVYIVLAKSQYNFGMGWKRYRSILRLWDSWIPPPHSTIKNIFLWLIIYSSIYIIFVLEGLQLAFSYTALCCRMIHQ